MSHEKDDHFQTMFPKSASRSSSPRSSRLNSTSQANVKARLRALGYVRVSTEKQVTEGLSLDVQRLRIRAYCVAMDLDLIPRRINRAAAAGGSNRMTAVWMALLR